MPQVVLAGLSLFVGSLVQGAIGFAFGLISLPLLINAGYSLSQAVALMTISIGVQVLFGSLQLRDHIPWREVRLPALVRYLTMPLGILILRSIENLAVDTVRQIVGIALLVALGIRVFALQRPLQHIPLSASIATFSLSGLLQGMMAMGGPPIILWMTTRAFTARQARAFTMTLFLLNAPVQILLLMLLSDNITTEIVALAIGFVPLIFIGSTLGVSIGNRFSKRLLNNLALAVLVVIAVNAIL